MSRFARRLLMVSCVSLASVAFTCLAVVGLAGAAPSLQLETCGSGNNGDETSGGIATASAGTAASAFDDLTGTVWNTTTGVSGWVEYNFDTSVKVCVYEISGSAGANTSPKDFTLQANDGSGWVTIDTRTGITWSAGQIRSFTITNSKAANRWRLDITANGGGATSNVPELRLMEAATPGATFTPTITLTPTVASTATLHYVGLSDIEDTWGLVGLGQYLGHMLFFLLVLYVARRMIAARNH